MVRKKAEADEERRLSKGSSRSSGSVTDKIESIGSNRNHERAEAWEKSAAQRSVPRRPLSPDCVIDPPKNVTQAVGYQRFSTYPKTTQLFQPGDRLFSTQLTEPSILKKKEIRKTIRVTDPPARLTRTKIQKQGTSAFQNRNRSQSPINNSRSRSAESRNRSTVNQATPQVI